MSSLILFGVAGIVALYGGIFFSLRKRLSMLGTEREQVAALRHRLVGEIFGGIKEVKLHGLEAIYEGLTHQPFHRYAVLQSQRHLFSILPRYMFEAIGFVGLFLLVPVLRKAGGSVGAALPMLGMIGFAGYRLLPAIQQIYLNAVSLPIGRQALSTLHSELVGVDCGLPVEQAPLELRREIALRGATYAYPGAERMSIDHLDLRIEARTTVALVGRSGAGKSTLADLTIGLLVPTTGDLAIDGVELDAAGRRAWRANCAYVPQHVFLLDDTIAANIAFGVPAHLFDMQRIEAAARAAALHEFVSTTLPQGYATRIGERGVRLSGGQRQRIGIARALYRDAGYLVMDEATNALDPGTEAEVMLALDRLKGTRTVLVIAHRLSTVERCDRVLLIDGGRIVADGSYQDLLRDSSEFRRFANAGDIDDAMPLVPV
jgi:ABC-type multidrug transport system fused ATPase/permease subunit